MLEHHTEPLLSRAQFFARMARSSGIAFLITIFALGVGMMGYHYLESLPWMDAFANAAMILSGMGPLMAIQTNAGKLFAGFYALFSGLTFVSVVGVILVPLIHRFLHKFHLEDEDDE